MSSKPPWTWKGKTHLLEKPGHAPFRDAADRFNPIFARFLASVDRPWDCFPHSWGRSPACRGL
ncbi:hypothetical protein LGH82_13645 [Mesorhizobium sp. PAMC28654]|uniref:hypothetical protein n=1 Tax=Mesorhizobium sp. PAMC28654 TaxID=2880934 RepID=UPI001D0B8870|nr:hypothetical protein [Mesorhizobium sp. PAMC28654]UDL92176.1 hypothetical protein LGH82_13645 [Mesorhizobium sp. PAMC28654]